MLSPQDSGNAVVQKLSEMVRWWQIGLEASGGALKPEKCSWCLLDFTRVRGIWRLKNTSLSTLRINGADGQPTDITRLSSFDAVEAVGVRQSMDGKPQRALSELQSSMEMVAHKLASGWIPRYLTWTMIDRVVWPSLNYSLPPLSFSYKEGSKLISKLYQALLPALGVNRHFPLSHRYAPADF